LFYLTYNIYWKCLIIVGTAA